MITSFVQDAGVAALNSDQTCVGRQAAHYAGRRAIVADGLRELGYDLFDSQGGLYVWMHAPAGRSGEEVADDLLDQGGRGGATRHLLRQRGRTVCAPEPAAAR